ncbi:hypothetical protein TRAPUB_335, partial [Trametes pubescens]
RRKTNNKPRDASTSHGSTAAESVRNLIKKKPKYSKRVNYNALKDVFTDAGSAFQAPAADDENAEGWRVGRVRAGGMIGEQSGVKSAVYQ